MEELDRRQFYDLLPCNIPGLLGSAQEDLRDEGLEQLAGSGIAIAEGSHEQGFEISFLIQGLAKAKAGDERAEIAGRVDDWCAL